MIITNLDYGGSSFPLVNLLQASTKIKMKAACRFFGFSIPQGLRKNEFIALVAKAFLTHVSHWISFLNKDEALLLRELVEAGPEATVKKPIGQLFNVFEEYDLLLGDDREMDQGVLRYMICDELREAIAPHIANLFASDKQQQLWEIEQYAYGLVNLYGYLPVSEIVNKLYEIKKQTISKDRLLEILYSASIKRFMFLLDEPTSNTTCIRTPFLNTEEITENMNLRLKEIKELKYFTDEEIYEAGRLPYPQMPIRSAEEVRSLLIGKLRMTELEADFNLQNIWLDKQLGVDNPMSAISSLIKGKLHSMTDLGSAISILIDYVNSIPVWYLRGYSSKEASRLLNSQKVHQTPPRIIAGPGMRAAGLSFTPEMHANFEGMYRNEMNSSRKVGRNDPCPCGSGKKYKQCCARINPN